MKIVRLSLSKLLKLEIPQFILGIIAIVEEKDPQLLRIDGIFNLLAAQVPNLKLIDAPYGPHPLTEKLDLLRDQRLDYAAGITGMTRALKKMNLPSMRDAIELVEPVVQKYLINLRRNNKLIITELIFQFVRKIEEDEVVKKAFSQLGYDPFIEQLAETNKSFLENLHQRGLSMSKRRQINTPQIIDNLFAGVRNLFLCIELAQVQYPELDYKMLIVELNTFVKEYKDDIEKRKKRNKKKKEKLKQRLLAAAEINEFQPSMSQNNLIFIPQQPKELMEAIKGPLIILNESHKAFIGISNGEKSNAINGIPEIVPRH